MATDFSKITNKYKTSEDIECDSYDEARLVEVLRNIPTVFFDERKAVIVAKAILEEFYIFLNTEEGKFKFVKVAQTIIPSPISTALDVTIQP